MRSPGARGWRLAALVALVGAAALAAPALGVDGGVDPPGADLPEAHGAVPAAGEAMGLPPVDRPSSTTRPGGPVAVLHGLVAVTGVAVARRLRRPPDVPVPARRSPCVVPRGPPLPVAP